MAGRFGMGRVVCRVWFWVWFLRVGGGGVGWILSTKSVDLASIVFLGGVLGS